MLLSNIQIQTTSFNELQIIIMCSFDQIMKKELNAPLSSSFPNYSSTYETFLRTTKIEARHKMDKKGFKIHIKERNH